MSEDEGPGQASAREGSALAGWLVLPLVLVAMRAAWSVAGLASSSRQLPLWDEAKYGRDALRLAEALRSVDPAGFLGLVHGLDDWPPLFPLYQAAALMSFGYDYSVARVAVSVLFFLLVVATWWAGRRLAPDDPAVGVLAALLVLSSPMVQRYGALVMLEVPGALLLMLSLGSYGTFLRSESRRALTATCVFSVLLFFCKYNYGLLWLGALFLCEAHEWAGSWRQLVARALAAARDFDLRRPWPLLLLTSAVALAWLVLSGGTRFEVMGREVSITSPGNPVFALCLVVIARFLLRPRNSWRRYRTWRESVAPRHRRLVELIGAPIAL
jgi:hypothetical protein